MAATSATIGRVRILVLMFSVLAGSLAWAEPVDYGEATEAELDALGTRWSELTNDERRGLLTEVHRRMIAAGRKPVLRIRAERRYGYRVQQPDGSVVEIQRREGFVRYRELNPDQPFGVGFEQRSGLVPVEPTPSERRLVELPGPEARGARDESWDESWGKRSEEGPVPRASRVPVYQLPFREVLVAEPPQ